MQFHAAAGATQAPGPPTTVAATSAPSGFGEASTIHRANHTMYLHSCVQSDSNSQKHL